MNIDDSKKVNRLLDFISNNDEKSIEEIKKELEFDGVNVEKFLTNVRNKVGDMKSKKERKAKIVMWLKSASFFLLRILILVFVFQSCFKYLILPEPTVAWKVLVGWFSILVSIDVFVWLRSKEKYKIDKRD